MKEQNLQSAYPHNHDGVPLPQPADTVRIKVETPSYSWAEKVGEDSVFIIVLNEAAN